MTALTVITAFFGALAAIYLAQDAMAAYATLRLNRNRGHIAWIEYKGARIVRNLSTGRVWVESPRGRVLTDALDVQSAQDYVDFQITYRRGRFDKSI